MEFDIAGLGIHNTGVERLSMEFDIADGSSYSWSMEFDIVELWKRLRSDCVTCRWSSTSLTYGWSMEFDIVHGLGDGCIAMGRLKFGAVVRPCRTVLSAAEFAAGRTRASRRSRVPRYCGALGPASVLGGVGEVPSPTTP